LTSAPHLVLAIDPNPKEANALVLLPKSDKMNAKVRLHFKELGKKKGGESIRFTAKSWKAKKMEFAGEHYL